jgi:hypothetical protein
MALSATTEPTLPQCGPVTPLMCCLPGHDRPAMMMSPRQAQALQDEARARGTWIMWFVSTDDPEHPGQVVARAQSVMPPDVVETWD